MGHKFEPTASKAYACMTLKIWMHMKLSTCINNYERGHIKFTHALTFVCMHIYTAQWDYIAMYNIFNVV